MKGSVAVASSSQLYADAGATVGATLEGSRSPGIQPFNHRGFNSSSPRQLFSQMLTRVP